ncbi:Parkinson disease protein 7 homolog [Rhopilema esculentum]|uniref:Parkinson disease protein 7 homolog n=1 Tax=Rhopilema esculentum TaxID=499914 RepID=UPI0031D8FD7B
MTSPKLNWPKLKAMPPFHAFIHQGDFHLTQGNKLAQEIGQSSSWFAAKREKMASKRALVVLAKGAEEMEAVISIDVLRRAKVDTVVAGLHGSEVVTCSRGVFVKPDISLEDVKKEMFDAVVLPGGLEGAQNLAESSVVKEILQSHEKDGKIVAAICAGPIAFATHGIGKGKKITSHPSVKEKFDGYSYQEQTVVTDNNMITSRGPGTAFDFAFEVVNALCGEETVKEMKKPMLIN